MPLVVISGSVALRVQYRLGLWTGSVKVTLLKEATDEMQWGWKRDFYRPRVYLLACVSIPPSIDENEMIHFIRFGVTGRHPSRRQSG